MMHQKGSVAVGKKTACTAQLTEKTLISICVFPVKTLKTLKTEVMVTRLPLVLV